MNQRDTQAAASPSPLCLGADPRLAWLLEQLPGHGIDVLPEDYRRIALVIPPDRELDWQAARELLVALLAKNTNQRQTLRRLYQHHIPRPSPAPDPNQPETDAETEAKTGSAPATGQTATSQRQTQPGQTDNTSSKGGYHAQTRRWPILRLTLALLAPLLLISGWFAWQYLQPTPPIAPPTIASAGAGPTPTPPPPGQLPSEPSPTFHSWAPVIETADPWQALGSWLPSLALLLTALAAAGWLGQRLYNRRHPRFDPVSLDPAPDTPPGWLATDCSAPPLLDPARRREMIWGVQRFESEHPLTRLDIPATVSASARQGIPSLHFARARHPREVWLWLDVRQQAPEARQLWQLANSDLDRAGLATRPARFAGLPDPVFPCTSGDQRAAPGASPADLDSAARQAMVAIFTDGADIATMLHDPEQAQHLHHLSRDLARWPRLCLVDFSTPGLDLPALGSTLGLTVIQPHQLPLWLAERPLPSGATAPVTAPGPTERQWAALCSLPGLPITLQQARELRATLGLPPTWPPPLPPGWQQQADGITLSPSRRRQLLSGLARQLDPQTDHTSRLHLALDYWQQRLSAAATALPPAGPKGPARDRHQLDIEEALLDLWRSARVPDAARRLYARWKLDPRLRADITRRLRELAPAAALPSQPQPAAATTAPIPLPWHWRDLPEPTAEAGASRWLLTKMGLGRTADGPQRTIRACPAAEALLLLGLCLGLAAAAGLDLANRLLSLAHSDILHDQPIYTSKLFQTQVTETRRNGRLYAASHKLTNNAALSGHSDASLHWCWTGLPPERLPDYCQSLFNGGDPRQNPVNMGNSLLLHAGTLAEPIRACADPADPNAQPWPALSVAVIAAEHWKGDRPHAQTARQLAIELLDSGAADLALIGPDWAAQARRLNDTWGFIDHAQWLFFIPADAPDPPSIGQHRARIAAAPGDLARWLERDLHGALPAAQLPAEQGQVQVLSGQPQLWGGPRQRDIRLADGSDMTMVELCPGSYTRGSAADDPQADEDERPAHPLLIPGFEIAATETTRAQARALLRGLPPPPPLADTDEPSPPAWLAGNDDGQLPATSMSWSLMAQACAQLPDGPLGRPGLPSEAQWEYAARAGSQTPWSWGADQKGAASHAWFNDNSNNQTHPVASKLPNPAGLYDMHGNAWEWTLDCYEGKAYRGLGPDGTAMPPVDAACTTSSRRRVLRGGAFDFTPGDLRSANRDWLNPGNSIWFFGFRCVRGSARSSID